MKILELISVVLFIGFAIAIGAGQMVADTWFVVFMCISIAVESLLRFFKD